MHYDTSAIKTALPKLTEYLAKSRDGKVVIRHNADFTFSILENDGDNMITITEADATAFAVWILTSTELLRR